MISPLASNGRVGFEYSRITPERQKITYFAGTFAGIRPLLPFLFRGESWKSTTSKMAPKVGLEPTTDRLTADCSTIELLWIPMERGLYKAPFRASTDFTLI